LNDNSQTKISPVKLQAMKLIPFPKLLDIQQQQEVYKEITSDDKKVQSFVSYNQPIIAKNNLKQQSF